VPLYYLGAGLLGFLFLSSRRARAAAALPDGPTTPAAPPPAQHYGLDESAISVAIPAGWRRMKQSEVTPEYLAFANAQRSGVAKLSYGTTIPYSDSVMAMVEQHYHEPLGPAKPWGYHHGITLLTRA